METFCLRRYRSADRDACLRLFESNIPSSFFPYEIPEYLGFLDYLPGPYLVVEGPGGALAGCGGIADHHGAVTLCWGMVARDLQHQGIGRLLLQVRLALALDIPDARRVILNTSQRTAGFFEKEGFTTRHVQENFFAPGMHRHDMKLTLSNAARANIHQALANIKEAGHRVEAGLFA